MASAGELWIRFLSGPDIDSLGLSNAEIIDAVEGAVRAHGDGRVVVEPRVHLVPDNDGAGHFNVLRGHLSARRPAGVSGVKVVGDFVANYAAGLPSELGLLTLYDPDTGVPLSIMDATMITACRTGAMTAVGARYLARPDSRVLGHVGARGTAFWNVVLLDELFDLDEIRVTSRRPESREAFAQQLAAVTGTRVRVTATAEEVFDGADILVEASRLTEPEPLLRTAVGQARCLRRPLRHGQRRGTRPARRDGQGGGRRLAGGAVGPVRRAAPPRGHRPALGRVAPRRAGPDRHRAAARPGTRRRADPALAPRPRHPRHRRRPGHPAPGRAAGRRNDAPVPLAMPALAITRAGDADLGLIRAVAAGQPVSIGPDLLAAVRQRCEQARQALRDGQPVYGVNTGMGALSSVRLTEQQQRSHQRNLLLARATGGPPWLSPPDVRAIITVRLLTFLSGDAAVSGELCQRLADFLNYGIVPAVPQAGAGSAGEITQLAHAFGPLAGIGRVLGPGGALRPAGEALRGHGLTEFSLGPKEGIALIQGVPGATGLAVLRLGEAAALASLMEAAAALSIVGDPGAARSLPRRLRAR